MEYKGKEIRYVGERTIEVLRKRAVGSECEGLLMSLSLGDVLVPATDQSDPYRVLSMTERFWQSVADIERLGEKEAPCYGFTYFDIEELDPFSREVRGPFTHTGVIYIDFDKLPEGEGYRITTSKDSVLKYAYNSNICIDPEQFPLDADGISEAVDAVVLPLINRCKEKINEEPIINIKDPRTLLDGFISNNYYHKVIVRSKVLDDEVMDELISSPWGAYSFVKGY